jgi:hypothetical protein
MHWVQLSGGTAELANQRSRNELQQQDEGQQDQGQQDQGRQDQGQHDQGQHDLSAKFMYNFVGRRTQAGTGGHKADTPGMRRRN